MRRQAFLTVILILSAPFGWQAAVWAQKAKIGDSFKHYLDSGKHDNSTKSVLLAFEDSIEVSNAPWIRLRIEDARLGVGDYIEITSDEDGKTQIIYSADINQGEIYTTYFAGSRISIKLNIGPGAKQSGITVTEVHFGLQPSELKSQCGAVDDRVASADTRVCQLRMVGQACSEDNDWCGDTACPGGMCTNDICDGGSRNGLGCGCSDGTCNAAATFIGTAFFIEATMNACMLSAGHNVFRNGSTVSTVDNVTLHCEPFTDDMSQCTGANVGVMSAVAVLAGEFTVLPHDWSILSSTPPGDAGVFGLIQPPAMGTVTVTGYGADTGASNFCQQTHTSGGTRAGDIIDHTCDTQGGNSGSPIILSNQAWGIHTNGGCSTVAPIGSNRGVWVHHDHLAAAITTNCQAALAVQLASFEAEVASRVTLRWATSSEIDSQSFQVLRSTDPFGDFEAVNSRLIPARGGPASRAEYEFVDGTVHPGITYYYLLDEVDTAGVNTRHGADACTLRADQDCKPLAVTVPGLSSTDY